MAYPERVLKAIQRAQAAVRNEAPDLALQELQKAVAKYPKATHAWSLMGQCLVLLEDHAGAERALTKAVALDARHPEGWFLLGVSLGYQGRHREALDAYTRYVSLCPGRVAPPNVVQNIAASLIEIGEYEASIPLLKGTKNFLSHGNA